MMLERTVAGFLDDLASSAPAPGGGAVAALSGALACSMVSMVSNLTLGKKRYADVEDEVREILDRSEELRKHFQELVEQDAEAFSDVMGALQMPKATEQQKLLRQEALEHALQKAAYVPLRTMENAAEALKLAHRIAQIGNKNLVSDAGVAAVLAESALYCGWFNVAVNLANIKDEEFAERLATKTQEILDQTDGLLDETMEIVEYRIYGEG